MEKLSSKIGAGAALVVGLVTTVMVGIASAQADPTVGETVSEGMVDTKDQAMEMWPVILVAGLAMFSVTLLIRFGKRVFGASR